MLRFPCSPRIGVHPPGNFGTRNANFNRVDCLSLRIIPEEPRTVNGTEIESIRTCRTLVTDFQRATCNSSHVNTQDQPCSCRIAAQQPLPHHVQPLLWHVSTAISYSFAALASTRCHRLDRSTALDRINSLLSSPNHWAPCCVKDSNGIRRINSESTCLCCSLRSPWCLCFLESTGHSERDDMSQKDSGQCHQNRGP